MNQLKYCGVLIFLAILSLEDIREKRISVKTILIGVFTAMVFQLTGGQISGIEIAGSLIPGALLLLLSVITKESIGKGDGAVVMVLGL